MKAFASDIDGTLVFDGKIKDSDIKAIRKYQENNLFGVCSGRSRSSVNELIEIGLDFYILSTGALILDKDLNIIKSDLFDEKIARELFDNYYQKAQIVIQTESEKYLYVTIDEHQPHLKVINSFEEINGEDIYGVSLVFKNEEIAKKECLMLNNKYLEIEGFQNLNAIDFVKRGCSKGEGVKWLKEYYNLEQVAGIGDSYNDIPLIECSDVSFTFKHVNKELKDKVDYIVDSVEEAIGRLGD